ncbi:Hypothetical protein CINCED_3A016651 [Cinara cedri]|uniref:Uncharacterized protein n=1 Tax=Cinara cedri TaxID=506608 RepID=A0A5E4M050_9HEMI|nr:Hypothetical protein CINCED_3A016651 [Cinara cedri]
MKSSDDDKLYRVSPRKPQIPTDSWKNRARSLTGNVKRRCTRISGQSGSFEFLISYCKRFKYRRLGYSLCS